MGEVVAGWAGRQVAEEKFARREIAEEKFAGRRLCGGEVCAG